MSRWMWGVIAGLACAPAWADDPAPATAPVSGHMTSLPTAYQTRFDAYVAGPEGAPVGVLLVPDRWGLNAEVRAWADRVAALGCRVVAVDLYDGRPVRGDAQDALRVWRTIDPVWIESDLDGAAAELRRGSRQLVVMAWGKGVKAAAGLQARQPDAVAALVTYYDSESLAVGDRAGKLAIPVLDILTPRTLAGPPAAGLPPQAVADAWSATEQFLARLLQ